MIFADKQALATNLKARSRDGLRAVGPSRARSRAAAARSRAPSAFGTGQPPGDPREGAELLHAELPSGGDAGGAARRLCLLRPHPGRHPARRRLPAAARVPARPGQSWGRAPAPPRRGVPRTRTARGRLERSRLRSAVASRRRARGAPFLRPLLSALPCRAASGVPQQHPDRTAEPHRPFRSRRRPCASS